MQQWLEQIRLLIIDRVADTHPQRQPWRLRSIRAIPARHSRGNEGVGRFRDMDVFAGRSESEHVAKVPVVVGVGAHGGGGAQRHGGEG